MEQRNLERTETTVYELLQSAINNFNCVGMGWKCTDNPRKHVLFCFYFLLYEETSFYWQKDVSVPEGECCCELIMVRTFPIPWQFITPQGFLFKILIKMIFF